MKAVYGLTALLVAVAVVGSEITRRVAEGTVAYPDVRHHVDYALGLHLPFAVVENAHPGWLVAGCIWLVIIAIALVARRLAAALERQGANAIRPLVVAQIVIGIAFSLFAVTFSGDPYAYVIYGRLYGLHGINPYVLPAALRVPDDNVLAQCLAFYGNPPPSDNYGPLWTLMAGLFARVESGASLWVQVWTHRLVAVSAAVATSAGLLHILRSAGEKRAIRVATFAFAPLVVYESAVGGHNDMLMIAFAVWAFALVSEYPLFAGLLMGAAIGVKYVPVIALPFLALKAGGRSFAGGVLCVLVALIVPALCFKPFWLGMPTLYSLIGHSGVFAMSPTWIVNIPFFALGIADQPAFGALSIPFFGQPPWPRIIQFAFLAGFLAVGVLALYRYARSQRNAEIWKSITAFLWSSPIIHPWYVLWISPAAAGDDAWADYAWWFGLLVTLRYALDSGSPAPSGSPVMLATFVALTLVFLFVPVVVAVRRSKQRVNAKQPVVP